MESHPYTKITGVGVPPDASDSQIAPKPSHPATEAEVCENEVCQHIDGRGHRCRMLVMGPRENLCPHHRERLLLARRGREIAAKELVDSLRDFGDAKSVHDFLATLLKQVALQRIPRRDAVTLAYICQTILNTHAAGYREALFHREERRDQALAAARRPPEVVWDLPHPSYEPDGPVEPEARNNSR
jgi:hypothetical protein